MTAFSDETGRGWLPLKYEDGPDFCTVTFATGAAFALTVHPERMKLMEAALSASPVAQEPVAYQFRIPALAGKGWSAWTDCSKAQYEKIADGLLTGSREPSEIEIRRLYTSPPATPAGVKHDDPLDDLVARFSAALLAKLKAARVKYGYEEGWREPGWESDCQKHLLTHLAKGDPRDVAAYCAFMWHHGWETAPPPAGVGADEIARAVGALRYLAENDRPQGGQSRFNAEHLYQIADELVGKRPPDFDAAIKEAIDCITDLGSGKGGWAWEEVIQRLALLSRGSGES